MGMQQTPRTPTWNGDLETLEWSVEWGACNAQHENQQNLDHSPDSPDSPEQPETVGLFRRPTSLCVITNSGSARCDVECPRPRPSPCAIIPVPGVMTFSFDSTECYGVTWRLVALRRPGAFPLPLDRTRRPVNGADNHPPQLHA